MRNLTTAAILETLRRMPPKPETAQIRIFESPHLVEIGPLVTVRRTWRERLFDWPWLPWQATREERSWVPMEKAIYDSTNNAFYVHPALVHALRSQLSVRWPANIDTRPHPATT